MFDIGGSSANSWLKYCQVRLFRKGKFKSTGRFFNIIDGAAEPGLKHLLRSHYCCNAFENTSVNLHSEEEIHRDIKEVI
jgi:hypothetical protein